MSRYLRRPPPLAGGRLQVELQEALPLDRAADAHRLLETGRTRGKIVLVPPTRLLRAGGGR